jgi:hypothetical protein
MIDHYFADDKQCLNKLKTAFQSKDKDTSQIDNECLLKLHEYLKMLDTQFEKQVSNSIMISSILKS